MKFGRAVALSSRDVYLKGTMKFCSYFLEFRLIYIKRITQNPHVVPLKICAFSKNLWSGNRTFCSRAQMKICPHFSHFSSDLDKFWYGRYPQTFTE